MVRILLLPPRWRDERRTMRALVPYLLKSSKSGDEEQHLICLDALLITYSVVRECNETKNRADPIYRVGPLGLYRAAASSKGARTYFLIPRTWGISYTRA